MKPQSQPGRLYLLSLHGIFFLSGIATVLIGQVLPILARRFALSDLESGNFFPAQFAGSITGTLISGHLGRKGKLRTAAAAGAILMAAGVFLTASPIHFAVAAGFFLNGTGIGLTLPSINILVLESNPERAAAKLSFLNFFWGLGAIVSKPFVDLTASASDTLYSCAILAAFLLFSAAMLSIAGPEKEQSHAATRENSENAPRIWKNPAAWAIAVFNFIHVGFESGMGGWLTTFSERLDPSGNRLIFSPTVIFFLLFVIGRGVAPAIFRYLDEDRMLAAGLFVVMFGLTVILTSGNNLTLSVGAGITGFGTSSIFPSNISRFSRIFGPGSLRRATPLFICGTLGAASITWSIGLVSDLSGSLRIGLFLLAASVSVLMLLQALIVSLSKRNASGAESTISETGDIP